MRLGQGHGAEEATVDDRLQEALFLLVAAEGFDQVGHAHGQHRVQAGGAVGGLEVSEAGLRQQVGQLHAALLEIPCGVEETGFVERAQRRLDLRDQHGAAVHVLRLVFIALAVVRGEQLFGDTARGADRRIEGLAVVIGEPWALGQGFGVEYFIEFEGQVAGAEQGLGHGTGLLMIVRV